MTRERQGVPFADQTTKDECQLGKPKLPNEHSKHLVHLDKAGSSNGLANRRHQASAFVGELRFTVLDLSKVTLLTPHLV